MQVHWIWLSTRLGLSDRDKRALLDAYRDPERLYYADRDSYDLIPGLTSQGKDALCDKRLAEAEKILDTCMKKRLGLLTYQDAAYPSALKTIPDPPLVLYYKGRLPDFDGSPVIAVVGTRKATAYGLTTAKRLGTEIARCGGILVSGMAFGIDAMAMEGALSAGGTVVGVLGCGADVVYPRRNAALFKDTEACGCILSEFVPGTEPAPWTFPKRNRIISGLSNGTLVVEAPEKSGALITARLAAEQGRDVYAVPGNIDLPTFAGSNRLLRDGAAMVCSGWDILCEYEGLYPDKIRKDLAAAHLTAYPDEVAEAAAFGGRSEAKVAQKAAVPVASPKLKKDLDRKTIDKEPKGAYSDVNDLLQTLSGDEQAVIQALQGGQRLVDEVSAETGLAAGRLLMVLTALEMKGLIKRLPGRCIARANS